METCSVELLVTIFLAKLFLPIDNDPNIMSYSYQLLSLASNSPLSLKQNMQKKCCTECDFSVTRIL